MKIFKTHDQRIENYEYQHYYYSYDISHYHDFQKRVKQNKLSKIRKKKTERQHMRGGKIALSFTNSDVQTTIAELRGITL